MNQIELLKLEEMLLKKKDQVISSLHEIATHNESTDDWEMILDTNEFDLADINTAGDSDEEAEERIATLALLETEYRNIIHALKKIDSENFGLCEICNQPIETRRLEVEPAARTCQTHKEEEFDLPLI